MLLRSVSLWLKGLLVVDSGSLFLRSRRLYGFLGVWLLNCLGFGSLFLVGLGCIQNVGLVGSLFS